MLFLLAAIPAAARSLSDEEAIQLSLSELLEVEVYSTDRYVRDLSWAASSASVISAEDIRRYGYRSLTDILKSLPGLYVTYDRNYSYLGSRGFGVVGDWNSRILFLVDGQRVNENVYDGAYIGNDFIVDVGLIDRVEYVAGPAAAMLYGNNAFFGVVNVITRTGQQTDGAELVGGVGNAGSRYARAAYGRRYDTGLDILLSASRLHTDGRDLTMPEFDGVAHNLDYERADRIFGKFSQGEFSLEFAGNERTKGIPNASYDQVFDDQRSRTVDEQRFLSLNYNRTLGKDSALGSRVYYAEYDYVGDYIYDPGSADYRDTVVGRWWGAEVKFVGAASKGHKLLVGGDFQRNVEIRQKSGYVGQASDLDDKRSSQAWGIYLHDEMDLAQGLKLDLGGRYDHPANGDGEFLPRLGLIRQWQAETRVKLLYGEAFRPPNAYELYYDVGDGYAPNPDLKPERIKSMELVLEHRVGGNGLLMATLFRNDIKGLIDYLTLADDTYRLENLHDVRTIGLELRYERELAAGGKVSASYTGQHTRDLDGNLVQNSPRHLAKLNWRQPVFETGLQAGLELQYIGSRLNYAADRVDSTLLTNLTLSSTLHKQFDLSLTVNNLFNRHLADPAAIFNDPLGRIRLDGRTWYLQAGYRF
ncbi:MAG: TonB-dependent receptor [Thiobacillus sp.]|nr:TonB-dependent receptor [Thiobacillus sp.]